MITILAIVASAVFSILPTFPLNSGTGKETLMLIAGREEAVRGFENAANDCRLKGVSRMPARGRKGTLVRVEGSSSDLKSEPLRCATHYLLTHMEGPNALSIIGNAAK